MAGQLPFIDLDGVEIANAYRTASYLQRGLGPMTFNVGSLGCLILSREIGGVGPFVSPAADPAPWYDATVPESAEFLGFVPNLDFQTIDVKRSISQRFGGIGGGVVGVEQFAARVLSAEGMIIASTCAGLEYGRHWLYSRLGADCAGCALGTLRIRESCPPDNGTNDTRGERIMYDAALVDGIQRTDDGGYNCCEYDGISFKFASQSPYLYSRAGAPTTAVAVQSTYAIMPPSPAVLDTFVRANVGPPPSASWTGPMIIGSSNTLTVLSNQLNNTSAATGGSAYWNAANFGPDVIVSVVVPARVTGGVFNLYARIENTPNTTATEAVYLQCQMQGAIGADSLSVGRTVGDSNAHPFWINSVGGQTIASGDTVALVCRGMLLEAWQRVAATGVWSRIVAGLDIKSPPITALPVGVQINSLTAVGQHLGAFSAGTITNPVYPADPILISMPAVSVGVTAPILTFAVQGGQITMAGIEQDYVRAQNVRIQVKHSASGDCIQTDDFSVDDLATRWTQVNPTSAGWTISGGKLHPTGTGLVNSLGRKLARRNSDGTASVYRGGRVEAKFTTGAVIAGGGGAAFGVWGVFLMYGAYIYTQGPMGTNLFVLNNDANGGTLLDSTAFTPAINTQYRVIMEALPLPSGLFDLRAYLVNPATNQMLVRPLRATSGTINPIAATSTPRIEVSPAGTDEVYDDFVSIDYSDEATFMNVQSMRGTLIIDSGRRVSQFTSSKTNSISTDGSAQLSTPIDTAMGWPELCAGDGPGCLQIWGAEAGQGGLTVQAAMQNRQR